MTDELRLLSQRWNGAGRQHAARTRAQFEAFHTGKTRQTNLGNDPRDQAIAARVLDAVAQLNVAGRWRDVRGLFDPAHQPFIANMGDRGLPFVVALGEDSALFRRGSTYQDGHLWHVQGDTLTPHPEFAAAAISANRRWLALADGQGIRVVNGWGGERHLSFPWPREDQMIPDWVPAESRAKYSTEVPPGGLESLAVSNDGNRVMFASRGGVMVGSAREGEISWSLALPRHDQPSDWVLEELAKGEEVGFHGDMVHAAMTADGALVGCGAQDDGHYLLAVDDTGAISSWAELGHISEYPHMACFSGDGEWAAFNSCHFYNGATLVANVLGVKGLSTDDYSVDARTPTINEYLRVYAATWLPSGVLPSGAAAFVLAGSSVMTIVGVEGQVEGELMFGSSASGVDYCPRSRTLVLGSYSGFLHFLRPSEVDPIGLGWKPPLETKRWCFFKDLPPLQW